jgi:hypothetical protein
MPVKWYSSLVLICLLGVALIVYSRYERQHPPPAVQPAIGAHWYQAVSFDVCGTLRPNLPANPTATAAAIPGIRTSGDGVIQVAPTVAGDTGSNATLARFVTHYPKLTLTTTTLKFPTGVALKNGQKCAAGTKDAGQTASLQIKVWPSFTPPGSNHPVVFYDPGTVKLVDGQLITVAFVPSGANIPKPNSIVALLNDRLSSTRATPTTLPSLPATTVPALSTSTTRPTGSTSTTQGK